MKMFVTFAIVILTTTLSFDSHATLVQLLNELELKLTESNWVEYKSKLTEVQDAIVELPGNSQSDHNRRLDLLEIKRLLKQCEFFEAYKAIDAAVSTYLPTLHSSNGGNPHDEHNKTHLVEQIQKSNEYDWTWSEYDRWTFIELTTDLAEYYFYNDELQCAESLLNEARKNLFGTEPVEGSENFHPEQRTLEIRILKLMGDVYYHMDNYDEAEIWYQEALSFFDNLQEPSELRGFVCLGLTQILCRQGETIKAYPYFEKAMADFANSLRLAKAHANLVTIQWASILRPTMGFDQKRALLNEACDIFNECQDRYTHGLTFICLGKLLRNPHENQEDADTLETNAAEIAQHWNIPLLTRILRGEAYEAPAVPTPDLADEDDELTQPIYSGNAVTQTQLVPDVTSTPPLEE